MIDNAQRSWFLEHEKKIKGAVTVTSALAGCGAVNLVFYSLALLEVANVFALPAVAASVMLASTVAAGAGGFWLVTDGYARHEAEVQAAENRLRTAQDRLQAAQVEINTLKSGTRFRNLENRLAKTSRERGNYELSLTKAKEQVGQLQRENDILKRQHDGCEQNLTDAKVFRGELLSLLTSFKEKQSQLELEVFALIKALPAYVELGSAKASVQRLFSSIAIYSNMKTRFSQLFSNESNYVEVSIYKEFDHICATTNLAREDNVIEEIKFLGDFKMEILTMERITRGFLRTDERPRYEHVNS